MANESFWYSEKYFDDNFEYRHVVIDNKTYAKVVPHDRRGELLTEAEWRDIGITQSQGWEHYAIFSPEPNVFLFRRSINRE